MIIGLTGYQGSGKSEAAKYLHQKGFHRHNFKDALVKEMKENLPGVISFFGDLYGMTVDELFENKPVGFREQMQDYGTGVRRKDDPEYWIKQWAKNSYSPQLIVCDDVRFLNEADKVKERGGIIIRIVRSDITTGGNHSSETEMNSIEADYTIVSEKGDIEGLQMKLSEIVEQNI